MPPANRRDARSGRASWRPTPWSAASTAITWRRKSTSSRGRSPRPSKSVSAAAACWLRPSALSPREIFARTQAVQIVACGTSYHAGLVARYLIESLCRIPCMVEIASEYRYRQPVVPEDTLYVTISQSGETAGHARGATRGSRAWAIWRSSVSATRRRARWCASRTWC